MLPQIQVPLASSETSAAFLQMAVTIGLVGICLLLYWRYRKASYLIWAGAWFLYSLRLVVIIAFIFTTRPMWLYWHQVATGLTALALLWAALVFSRRVIWRWEYVLLVAYPVVWSYVAIYRMENFLLAAAPAVAFLSIATLWTGWVFLQHHRRAGSSASLLLAVTFLLWAIHHLDYPFLRGRGVWNPWGYYIDIVFELAMGAGILLIVGEELQRGLQTLAGLTDYLQAGGHRDDLTRALLNRAMALPAVRGAAFLTADEGGGTVLQGAGACSSWKDRPPPVSVVEVVGGAVQTERPALRDRSTQPDGTRSWVAALPVPRREGRSGVLIVVGEASDPFAALDTDFLLALGRQLGAALENAELYQQLEERTAELERLAARMVRQHEEESRRLSRELHDETAQVFAAVNMQLGLIRETASAEEAPALDRALELVGDGIRSIRSVTGHLRPPLLDDLGLVPALRGLIDEFMHTHDTQVSFVTSPVPRLSEDAELALFRALQEALSNIARHSSATQVDVRLDSVPGGTRLLVRDDGAIAEERLAELEEEPLRGTGLAGMKERVALLNGSVDIRADANGFELDIQLPGEEEGQ